MAKGDRRYSTWIHKQPCEVCQTTIRVEGHHSLHGTTYSPEDTRPRNSFEGARKGMGQKSHDYFLIPMCIKHHEPGIHQLGNYFEGWTREEANDWERARVAELRERYATEQPDTLSPGKNTRRAPLRTKWTLPALLAFMRKEAAHRKPDVRDALLEIADLVEFGKVF